MTFFATILYCVLFLTCGFSVDNIKEYPSLEHDLRVVKEQLGYLPKNFVRVSARSELFMPVAIQTYPLEGGARRRQAKAERGSEEVRAIGTPFPTLFWLTCPDISKAISKLEQNAYVNKIQNTVLEDEVLTKRLLESHRDYARKRWSSLTEDDRSIICGPESSERIRNMIQYSGIAGGNTTSGSSLPYVKCLHTHYAHFRSSEGSDLKELNPVGEIVHQLLKECYPSLSL